MVTTEKVLVNGNLPNNLPLYLPPIKNDLQGREYDDGTTWFPGHVYTFSETNTLHPKIGGWKRRCKGAGRDDVDC